MKTRSTVLTLASLSAAMDVKFSFFDALDEAEASAKRSNLRKTGGDPRQSTRETTQAYAQAR